MRCGRIRCVAGQGSGHAKAAPLRKAEWGRWGLAPMGFLSYYQAGSGIPSLHWTF